MNIDSMTVEQREGKNHGLVPPTLPGDPKFAENLGEVIILCQETKEEGFSPKVKEIITKYSDRELDYSMLEDLGYDWDSLVQFVKDDKCIEAGLVCHKYVTDVMKLEPKTDRDFIDGEGGIGFYDRLVDRQKRVLEKAFNCKWKFKAKRPLQHLRDYMGEEAARRCVVYQHPGHWAYPAGHAAKFAATYDAFCDSYKVDDINDTKIFTTLFVAGCARSGGGVHFMEDNVASWSLVKGREIGNYRL